MKDAITINYKQLDSFSKGLDGLSNEIKKRIQLAALREAANMLAKSIRITTPIDSAKLLASIGTRRVKIDQYTDSFEVGSFVQSRRGDDAWYAGLVEYGHFYVIGKHSKAELRALKRTGSSGNKKIGWVPPNPFMRRAYDENIDRIQNAMSDKIGDSIAKAYARIARKAKGAK